MKTLEEHNQEKWDAYNAIQEGMLPHTNGIACPECGNELWDSDPTITLATIPPQKNVRCIACGYAGFRIA